MFKNAKKNPHLQALIEGFSCGFGKLIRKYQSIYEFFRN